MRFELRLGLLLNSLNLLAGPSGLLDILPDFASGFVSGLLTALGLSLIVAGMLPEKLYNRLAYRRALTGLKRKDV